MNNKNYTEDDIYSIYKEGENLKDKGKFVEALSKFKISRNLYSKLYSELHESVLSCYLNQAFLYRYMKRTDVSYVLFHLSLLIAKKINYKYLNEIILDVKSANDDLFKIIEQNKSSQEYELLDYFSKLLKINELKDYSKEADNCYYLLANICDRENDNDLAIDYLKLAIKNIKESKISRDFDLASIYEYMGNNYTKAGNLDQALNCYIEQGKYISAINGIDSEDYIRVEVSILRTYIYSFNIEKSDILYDKIYNTIDAKLLYSLNSLNMILEIADTYFDVKEYEKSIKSFKLALKSAKLIFEKEQQQYDMLYNLIKNKFKDNNLEKMIMDI